MLDGSHSLTGRVFFGKVLDSMASHTRRDP